MKNPLRLATAIVLLSPYASAHMSDPNFSLWGQSAAWDELAAVKRQEPAAYAVVAPRPALPPRDRASSTAPTSAAKTVFAPKPAPVRPVAILPRESEPPLKNLNTAYPAIRVRTGSLTTAGWRQHIQDSVERLTASREYQDAMSYRNVFGQWGSPDQRSLVFCLNHALKIASHRRISLAEGRYAVELLTEARVHVRRICELKANRQPAA